MNGADLSEDSIGSLHELDPSKLTAGNILPGSIFSAEGQVLCRAGQVLEPKHLTALAKRRDKGIFGEGDWPEEYCCDTCSTLHKPDSASQRQETSTSSEAAGGHLSTSPEARGNNLTCIDHLQPGTRLEYNIYSQEGTLLLAEGHVITPHFLDKLRARGICIVHVDNTRQPESVDSEPPEGQEAYGELSDRTPMLREWVSTHGELAAVETHATRRLDHVAQHKPVVHPEPTPTSEPRPRLPLAGLLAETQRAHEMQEHLAEQMAEVLQDVLRGREAGVSAAREVITQLQELSHLDASLLPAIVNPKKADGEYLFHHALCVASLSMSAAAERSLCPEEIGEIGLGALLNDVGMIGLPPEMRLAPRQLTEEERLMLKWHPFFSVDAMERAGHMSTTSMVIAYQSHERLDSSGYPRARHRMHIHPYAQIVAAADVYVSLCSERPHRPRHSPYEAMTVLLDEGRQNRIDREVIRTLLDCISLFPVGSHVRLSDGRVARVLRANPKLHTKPVVLPLNSDGSPSDSELDLSRVDTLHVAQPLQDEADLTLH